MSELYISNMTLRESRPRSKRLLGLGFNSRSFSGAQQGIVHDTLFDDLFEKVAVGTDDGGNPIYAIHAKYALYSDHNISAGGPGTSGSGGASTLAELADVQLGSLSNYDILTYNGGEWKNIKFSNLVNSFQLLSYRDNADITGNWCFMYQKALEFYNHGCIQMYGSYTGGQYRMNISASGGLWVNGVQITGGGGGGSVSWNQIVGSGTKIATITINGTTTNVYAPTGGGSGSSVSWGTDTGSTVNLNVDGVSKTLLERAALDSYLPLAGGIMTGAIIPNSASVNLGSSLKVWGEIHANRWYPKANDTTHYIEYTSDGFVVHGNIVASGSVVAGA